MRGGDLLQELQELVVAVPGIAGIGGDLPGSDLQRGEQRGGAVALVVIGLPGLGKPGRSASIGAVRSSAWIWLFSSTDTTTAFAGGSR